jgi:hypothetical protein
MSVALLVCQLRVVDWPASIVFGLAESEAVGAVGAGGGGGGGGAAFFAHALTNSIVARMNSSALHLAVVPDDAISCFTIPPVFWAAGLRHAICEIYSWRNFGQTQRRTSICKKSVRKD